MLSNLSKNNRFTSPLRDRLQTTSMGLGLVRLQMDAGLTEEARKTLAFLQNDFQFFLGLDKPVDFRAGENTNRRIGEGDSWDLDEELVGAQE